MIEFLKSISKQFLDSVLSKLHSDHMQQYPDQNV